MKLDAMEITNREGRTDIFGINPPRMPLGYIVETYPAPQPVGFPTAMPGPVLENNTFIPGENLPSTVGVKRPALEGISPIDLSTPAASTAHSLDGDSPSHDRDHHSNPVDSAEAGQLQDSVIMQCEEIPDDENESVLDNTSPFQESVEVLSDSSFESEGVSASESYRDEEKTAGEGAAVAAQDETLVPYSEVFTQRSIAYVIGGYAYTKNRQQLGKTYLRCRQRGCSARAMIMNNVQQATVFNNIHNHPPPDISKKARRRVYSVPPPYDTLSDGRGRAGSVSSPQLLPVERELPSGIVWQSPLGAVVPSGLQYQRSMDDGVSTVPRIVYVHSLQSSKMASTAKARLPEFLEKMERELDRVMEFWLKHSHDNLNGGFFVCLGRDGRRYDDLKYCWLQGRQVWMYSKLYNTVAKYHTPEVLEAAKKGGLFLMNYVKNPATGKCYFAVTKDGKAVKIQRTIFSECFYMLAMSELARATKDDMYKQEAIKMLDQLQHWVCVDDTGLGRPQLLGAPRVNSLSRGMIFLNLLDELTAGDPALQEKYASLEKWSIEQSLQHMQRDGTVILETVSTDGKELPGSAGRLMNPGHAIETGWFLLQCSMKHDLPELRRLAADNFIAKPFQTGWDLEHGGLYSFLDADGLSPTQLEWNMKLWWPHCEALIASLMAYQQTKEERFLEMFEKVFDYTFSRFVDVEHGEWFGYLNQEGKVTHDFKGGPFKGCFHVPRCLFMCTQMLRKLLKGE
ncbi:N-acylglucosamine 2-epimerase-like [Acanthaster planci]|uniref:N-acylglucosamine 2-epimerase n=1 Tax=Acanthaster planci TaxID=133434 RepID=A0A8B7XM83_ACAPL|nr:N-acylglucosamine 2-epimerase-like [Acanthaster planci]